MTSSDPGPAVPELPSAVGELPTTINPTCNVPNAVDSPSGAVPWKNVVGDALFEMRTMVVPVPCRLLLLLKFETRMSPRFNGPDPVWKLSGMNATPYGFTSPIVGMVETFLTGLGRNASSLSW